MFNKKSAKLVTGALVLSMVASLVSPTSFAAGKVKLNKTKLTIKKGKTATLKVKNAKVKAKWSIKSGKKVVKLTKKKKKSVKIKGLKKGSAVVMAKVGKKKLKCKVTVKNAKSSTSNTSTAASSAAANATSSAAANATSSAAANAASSAAATAASSAAVATAAASADVTVAPTTEASADVASTEPSVAPTEEATAAPTEEATLAPEKSYDPSLKEDVKMSTDTAAAWVADGSYGDAKFNEDGTIDYSSQPTAVDAESGETKAGSCYNNGLALLLNGGEEVDLSEYKYVTLTVKKDDPATEIKLMTWSDGADATSFWDKTDTWGNVVDTINNEDGSITLYYEVATVFADPATATALGLTLKSDLDGDDAGFSARSCTVMGFGFLNTEPGAAPVAETTAPETTAPEATAEVKPGDKVENIKIKLDGKTVAFTGSPAKIAFSEQLPALFDLKYFDSFKVDYKMVIAEGGDPSEIAMCKIALAQDEAGNNGYDDGVAYTFNAKYDAESVTIPLNDAAGSAYGINIQPMTSSYSWPEALESITITGIEFIAKADQVYPDPSTITAAPPTEEPLVAEKFTYEGLDTSWIDSSKKLVAFTFDDGPVGTIEGSTTMAIQDILHENNCHATFFYIGQRIENESGAAEEIKQAVSYGFEPGNHGPDWNAVSKYKTKEELDEAVGKTTKLLSDITGYSKFLFRAPNLSYSQVMYNYIDMPMINCAVDSKDWNNASVDEIIENVKAAKDGDVVLMHGTEPNTVAALPTLIKYFHDEGFEIVSVSELFAMKNVDLLTNYQYDSTTKAGYRKEA